MNQVEHGKGWANALIYEEPVALRKLNGVIVSTQTLLDRNLLGDGDFVGQAEVTSRWPTAYGSMTVIDAGKVRR